MQECILVTGGAGFIGSALSTWLVGQGLPVVFVDNMLEQVHPTGKPSKFMHEDVTLLRLDVASRETWEAVLEFYRPRVILHLAAETGTAQSLTESTRHATVNAVGTTQMLDAFARCEIRPERIILTSSRAVYGEGLWLDEDNDKTFLPAPRTHEQLSQSIWDPVSPFGGKARAIPHNSIEVPPNPTSVYGGTKLVQEHILSSWCGAFGVPLVITRLQNVFGEGQSPHNPYTGIINIFHKIARAGNAIPVYEDGDIVRDFVHIDDVVATLAVAVQGGADGRAPIDVGTGVATTILSAAQDIARFHGAPDPEICGKFRDGDVRSAVANIDLLRDVGVNPAVGFAEGAGRVGRWLIETNNI